MNPAQRGMTTTLEHVDTEAVLRLMQEVADRVINPRFRALADGEVHEKNPGDLVTIADHESEELLTAALQRAYPDAVVLGEEAFAGDPSLLDRYRAAGHAFTIDPVDGTKNFVHGSPDHAVMLSESQAGEVVRAWIWQPQHETAYVAEHGAGAWRSVGSGVAERLDRAAPPEGPAQLRGVTSRRSWLGRALPGLRPLELTWVCCGVDYPKVVEGAADYVLYGASALGAGRPWDHAPGSLLLAEAGGYVGTTGDAADATYSPRADATVIVAAAHQRVFDAVVAAGRAGPLWGG